MSEMATYEQQVAAGERFEFGKNWAAFLATVTDAHVHEAVVSLQQMLNVEDLRGRRFLDVGCGSGLFSLAALRLGASHVHSFDFDPHSVACTRELRRRYAPEAPAWTIDRGDALDPRYLGGLGQWDVVYSWGVLHHTGDMWRALANVAPLVGPGGTCFLAIYNDQGALSRWWAGVKRLYNRGLLGKALVCGVYVPYYVVGWAAMDVLKHRRSPMRRYSEYKRARGMSRFHDLIDWLGGYPFEVAKPEQIFDLYRTRGFELIRLSTCAGGLGCNQYVFRRQAQDDGARGTQHD